MEVLCLCLPPRVLHSFDDAVPHRRLGHNQCCPCSNHQPWQAKPIVCLTGHHWAHWPTKVSRCHKHLLFWQDTWPLTSRPTLLFHLYNLLGNLIIFLLGVSYFLHDQTKLHIDKIGIHFRIHLASNCRMALIVLYNSVYYSYSNLFSDESVLGLLVPSTASSWQKYRYKELR